MTLPWTRGMAVMGLAVMSFAFWGPQDKLYETLDLGNGKTAPFAYHLPNGYNASQAYPVLIGPGDGTRGSEDSFFWRKGDPSEHGWILVETGIFLDHNSPEPMHKLLDHLEQQFKVEGGGFHIVGFSANSRRTFQTVLDMPERFLSATGIPGHPTTRDTEDLAKLKNTTIQFIVGENDGYWRRESERANQQLQELGVDSHLEIVPNGGHILRDLIGKGFMKRMEKLRRKTEG